MFGQTLSEVKMEMLKTNFTLNAFCNFGRMDVTPMISTDTYSTYHVGYPLFEPYQIKQLKSTLSMI